MIDDGCPGITLGMTRAIDRRDFLDGVAVGIAALGSGIAALGSGIAASGSGIAASGSGLAASGSGLAGGAAAASPGAYPPLRTGLRGSHPGSFEAAHALRDGTPPPLPRPTGETFDLVIVGGGISGLAAAWFHRAANPAARILILDNHDDFGGHAKRNEYWLGGKLHLMNGGTMTIDSPRPYSLVASGLLKGLGIDPVALTKASLRPQIYKGLGTGLAFDTAHFGVDVLVPGVPDAGASPADWQAFLGKTPLSPRGRADVLRIETAPTDWLAGRDDAAKKDHLSRISYLAWLRDHIAVGSEALALYQSRTQGEWACGSDAVSALDAWGFGLPGFAGLGLIPRGHPRMSFTARGYVEGGSDTFHFPDGNASIARLLVRSLVPGAIPGRDTRDVVTARCDYARLDAPGNAVNIRLSSIATRVRDTGDGVEATYIHAGQAHQIRAGAAILACWNAMIPHLVPELPAAQQAALHALVKAPLVYTTVALRNWQAFKRLGVQRISAPNFYHSSLMLNWPVDIGGYSAERDPAKPILLFMMRTPCQPGLPEQDQNRAGRAELLETSFATFEREIRVQLATILGPAGFDPARDITGITVNRWPHGYAPEYNYLWQPDVPDADLPHIIGRARFGRIAIANSDSGGGAFTDVAIDQAWRAVRELEPPASGSRQGPP